MKHYEGVARRTARDHYTRVLLNMTYFTKIENIVTK